MCLLCCCSIKDHDWKLQDADSSEWRGCLEAFHGQLFTPWTHKASVSTSSKNTEKLKWQPRGVYLISSSALINNNFNTLKISWRQCTAGFVVKYLSERINYGKTAGHVPLKMCQYKSIAVSSLLNCSVLFLATQIISGRIQVFYPRGTFQCKIARINNWKLQHDFAICTNEWR